MVASTAAAGTCINCVSQGAREIVNRAQKRANGKKQPNLGCRYIPGSLGVAGAMAWPNNTVTPMVRPVITTVTACIIWLPVATADTWAVVENQPTTARSTPPYRACKSQGKQSEAKEKRNQGR